MIMRLLPLLIAFSLSACSQIGVDDAAVSNSKELNIERLQLKILDEATRKKLNAANPGDLIAVFNKNGVTLYGAPGKAFKFVPDEPDTKSTDKSKKVAKELVNDVVIKTFVKSPECQDFDDGAGNRIWYPSDCPH